MRVLVTGGAGYIGSHCCVELLNDGHQVLVLDNLCNSHVEALKRVEQLTGKTLNFIRGDIRDEALLDTVFAEQAIDAVLHFAGLKAVAESVQIPLSYYDNNVHGSRVLLSVMLRHRVNCLVFSSSATVYGDPISVPITEDFELCTTNPYGQSKLVVEQMCREVSAAEPLLSVVLLRYFNPVGAHPSGELGEDPCGIPNNLMPYISQVAVGQHPFLRVFGNDYDTEDGTGVRDYLHVVDLAKGHVKALQQLHAEPGCHTFNLGTGTGYSVLQVLQAFSEACDRTLPYQIMPRRAGDIACCYADVERARKVLGWRAEKTLQDMAQDAWRWQRQNPDGYALTADE